MSISRRRFLGTVAGSLLLQRHALAARRKKPNVLLVIADEWRYQSTGYGGDANVWMPNIDRFASHSINFENAISGLSGCCPARASFVTGQYPLTHGVYINDVPLKPSGQTLGELFSKSGYVTGYIGKWHLYGSPDGKWERRTAYIPPEYRFGFQYWKVAECTHDYNHSLYYENEDPNPKYWSGYDAEAQTLDACEFIQRHTSDSTPYMLVLSWGPPHFPLESAPARYQEIFKHRDLVLRPNVPANNREDALRDLRGYYAHIAALDDCFGRLLDTLEATATAADTIVVFTSDHGDMMYSQGLQHKGFPWDESIRVPLLIRYPRRFGNTGRRSKAPVNSPDLMPTLLGLSGIPIPQEVQGTDHSRRLDHASALRTFAPAFVCLPAPTTVARTYGFAEYRGVRDDRYTYVRSINGPWLLYDNHRDPYQMSNLCGKSETKGLQDRMEAELQRWLRGLDDHFMPAAEYVKRDGLSHYLETQFPVGKTSSPWGDWKSTMAKPETLSVDSAISDLLQDARARGLMERILGSSYISLSELDVAPLSLRLVRSIRPDQISADHFIKLERGLAELEP